MAVVAHCQCVVRTAGCVVAVLLLFGNLDCGIDCVSFPAHSPLSRKVAVIVIPICGNKVRESERLCDAFKWKKGEWLASLNEHNRGLDESFLFWKVFCCINYCCCGWRPLFFFYHARIP